MMERSQRGFTLVELMVVVVIVGVLMGSAVVRVRSDPSVDDEARHMAGTIAETMRLAVAGGAVREDVATTVSKARTRLRLIGDPADGSQWMVVDQLYELTGDGNYEWRESYRHRVSPGVQIIGYSDASHLATKTTPDVIFPVSGAGATEAAALECFPSGRCESKTFYLRDNRSGANQQRVVVMEFGASAVILTGW